VITFASGRLRLAAVRRRIVVERRTTSATANLARVPEGASGAELARPISHREIAERREVFAPSSAFDTPADGSSLDFRQSESRHPLTPLPRCWTRKQVFGSALTQGNAPCAELVDGHGLIASLVLHQVRPDQRSAVTDAGPQNHSSHAPKPGARPVAVAEVESTLAPGSAKSSPMPEAATSHALPTPLETLFTELARRRVRKLAIREKP
jgi:hypothetical protein